MISDCDVRTVRVLPVTALVSLHLLGFDSADIVLGDEHVIVTIRRAANGTT